MTFGRVLLGFVAVGVFLLAWNEVGRRLGSSEEPAAAAPAGVPWPSLLVEAGLLTLFAGLWFGSLGSGGAVLLFLLVGLLMEVPGRIRGQSLRAVAVKPLIGGVLRILVAGVLLGLVMG
ncbi:MAG: hypothetical protein SF070_11065 [Gemmatimonadota bacterium]|nr:hypothetical protein [Gemmatimonadota bacterium]